ncbi:BRCT domain-containing protein, partial [Ascobolus immersus RN42]
KGALTKSILDNGGAVIDSSLETLFTLPPLTPGTTISNPTLHLSPDEKEAANKQVVVVADKYCRREKFLQALALGLPVVHVRWVQDCAAHHKLLSWAAYQLPSGESAFLDGTVISRAHQPGLEGSLETMVERRPRLLSGKRMVFVV